MVDPPLGQVLHGRLARPAPGHLDHRCRLLRRLDRRRLHRLPLPAELRLAVDQHPGQGRDQLDRRRGASSTSPTSARCSCGTSCCCPLVVVVLVGLHVLLVRRRGVVPPFARDGDRGRPEDASRPGRLPARGSMSTVDGQPTAAARDPSTALQARPRRRGVARQRTSPTTWSRSSSSPWWWSWSSSSGWRCVFSSPDDKPVTVKSWSTANPVDFAQTAITELDGTSGTATYGPPYNSHARRHPVDRSVLPESWLGVHHPIDTAKDFVIGPLRPCPTAPASTRRSTAYTSASAAQQAALDGRLREGRGQGHLRRRRRSCVPPGDYGPVGPMIGSLTSMARSGALDGALLSSPQFYGTDYTKPLLFIADGTYLANLARAQHLSGDQWGMMNETGQLPGAGLAVALHALVPGPPDEHLVQRGPPGLGHHDGPDPAPRPRALHPRPALDPPLDPCLPPDLAPALPGPARRTKGRCPTAAPSAHYSSAP